MPKIAEAIADYLHSNKTPILTPYALFLIVSDFYKSKHWKNERIRIKGNAPKPQDLRRILSTLLKNGHLKEDADIPSILKVTSVPDISAEGYCQLIDPFCCISHYSAMQYHGLTDTTSPTLTLTTLAQEPWKQAAHERVNTDCAGYISKPEGKYTLRNQKLPEYIRGRTLNMHRANNAKSIIHAKETGWRITTLGETLKDMLERPSWCGGMPNVIDAIERHLSTCQEELGSSPIEYGFPKA